jgi:hypothetical protein
VYEQNNNMAMALSVVPATYTTTATGTAIDLAGFDAASIYVFQGATTDGTWTATVQDSNDNQTFGTATLNGTLATMTSATTTTVQEVGYAGGKRYVRVLLTVAAATTGGVLSAVVMKQSPKVLPA